MPALSTKSCADRVDEPAGARLGCADASRLIDRLWPPRCLVCGERGQAQRDLCRRLREVAALEPQRLPALRDAAAGVRRRRRGRGLRRLPAASAAAGAGARRLRLRPSARPPAAALQVPRRPGGRTPAGAARARCLRRLPTGRTRCSPCRCTAPACARAATTRRWNWRGRWRARCAFRCADDVLLRAARHRAAVRLDAPQRRRNLRGAFAVARRCGVARARRAGRRRHDHRRHAACRGEGLAPRRRRRVDAWVCARVP